MGRKTKGNGTEDEARKALGALIKRHLLRGTRPGGSPNETGEKRLNKQFAFDLGTSERNVTNWLSGAVLISPCWAVEIAKALFGDEPEDKAKDKYRKERHEFWEAYRLAGGGEPSVGPQSLVHDPGRCLGRDDKIAELVSALLSIETGASVLVLGDAGHGKTTLTEKVGVDPSVVARFGDRRWFVELESANDAVGALAEIAGAIGLERAAPFAAVQKRLAAKPTLLILDNLETPLHADSRNVQTLLCDLVATEGLAVMASLRGRESVGAVSWTNQELVEALPPDVAREMFLAIARNIHADDPDLDFFVGEMGVLDGIPLALRLVAQRASTRRVLADLRREWERMGALIAAEAGGKGSRRDSLIVSVELSLASTRLKDSGRRLFALLGQTPAGLSFGDLDVLMAQDGVDAAAQLRAVGLLRDRDGRIDLLSPIRDISKRRHRPEDASMTEWIVHFLHLATEEGEKIGKIGGSAAIARLVPEMPNVAASMAASVFSEETRLRAVAALRGFGCAMRYTGASYDVALDVLEESCVKQQDFGGQAKCKIARGDAARMQSKNIPARAEIEAALSLIRGRGESEIEAECLLGLADIARMQAAYPEARGLYEQARDIYQRAGNAIRAAECEMRASILR